MTNTLQPGFPRDLQLSIAQTDQKIQQMQAAAQLAASLKDMGPALTEITSLANNLVSSISNYNTLIINTRDRQIRRDTLVRIAPVIQTQLSFIRDAQKDLYRLLENASEAEKDRYLNAIMESITKACDLITNLIGQI
jgi:hypothetical protein